MWLGSLLQRLPISKWKWEWITIDFMSRLPYNSFGSDSVLVIKDWLTKFSYSYLFRFSSVVRG